MFKEITRQLDQINTNLGTLISVLVDKQNKIQKEENKRLFPCSLSKALDYTGFENDDIIDVSVNGKSVIRGVSVWCLKLNQHNLMCVYRLNEILDLQVSIAFKEINIICREV